MVSAHEELQINKIFAISCCYLFCSSIQLCAYALTDHIINHFIPIFHRYAPACHSSSVFSSIEVYVSIGQKIRGEGSGRPKNLGGGPDKSEVKKGSPSLEKFGKKIGSFSF